MYSAIHETDPPTVVNYSAFGRFLPGSDRQLATVSLKTLRIYRINPSARYIDEEDHEWKEGVKLECIHRVDLLAPVTAFGVARVPTKPDVDSFVMAFGQARVSILNFDPSRYSMETTSLHDFEDEELKEGFKTEVTTPQICVDSLQRCAAMLLYGRHLAILPFHEHLNAVRSYTVPLKAIDSRLDNIIDMVFLHGYYEPTLMIVYEPIQTTPGRYV